MITRVLLLIGAVLVFGSVNWQIAGKERLRANGQIVFLELAPIDPRSLMQGDYMALNFAVARAISPTAGGVAILELDPRRVGTYVRIDNGGPLNPNQQRLRFRMRNGAIWLGTNAFFFHEGDADRYNGARYGEFRVNGDGDAMLVGLRNKDLRKL
jgi:uncharacterized membrane-anchored protein